MTPMFAVMWSYYSYIYIISNCDRSNESTVHSILKVANVLLYKIQKNI